MNTDQRIDYLTQRVYALECNVTPELAYNHHCGYTSVPMEVLEDMKNADREHIKTRAANKVLAAKLDHARVIHARQATIIRNQKAYSDQKERIIDRQAGIICNMRSGKDDARIGKLVDETWELHAENNKLRAQLSQLSPAVESCSAWCPGCPACGRP